MKLNEMNVAGGGALVTRKTELATQESILKKMERQCDEHAKLVFLLDDSGSMQERLSRSYSEQYSWTPEVLADIRVKVNAALQQILVLGFNAAAEDIELARLADYDDGVAAAHIPDDKELKDRVIRFNLISALGVPVDFAKKHQVPPSRIEVVKKLAKQEIMRRFEKYPKSRIACVKFEGSATNIFDDGEPSNLPSAIDRLTGNGGSTSILNAINCGMDICRRKPSIVGIHHFIVVSDGEDYECSSEIMGWVPVLKASGVVLDYIHIGDRDCNANLKKACEALGGEAVTVNSEADLEAKFVEAVQRKMLPAGN